MNANDNDLESQFIDYMDLRGFNVSGHTLDFLANTDGLVVYDRRGANCKVKKRISQWDYWSKYRGNFKAAVQIGFANYRVSRCNGGDGQVDVLYITG